MKCGAASVRHALNGIQLGEGTYSALRPNLTPDFRGAFRQYQGHIDVFACTSCGYVELYAGDEGTRGYMAETWEPVEVMPPPPPPPPPPR